MGIRGAGPASCLLTAGRRGRPGLHPSPAIPPPGPGDAHCVPNARPARSQPPLPRGSWFGSEGVRAWRVGVVRARQGLQVGAAS